MLDSLVTHKIGLGINMAQVVDMKTMEPSREAWTIKSGKHAKGGLHMNFCPICGENLRGLFEHVFADRDAAAATTT